ncbi:hypothetical protein EVAR_31978_1 [Eumeta japonica]|uniref:Uncharacterized protein n=1 Tax=Eumeta variegata TaxID=151549 RepID=A0A4C1VSJ7_EUMVA|nr:hypothetical protein EVAR_31978_1 [Eumeta japonica]
MNIALCSRHPPLPVDIKIKYSLPLLCLHVRHPAPETSRDLLRQEQLYRLQIMLLLRSRHNPVHYSVKTCRTASQAHCRVRPNRMRTGAGEACRTPTQTVAHTTGQFNFPGGCVDGIRKKVSCYPETNKMLTASN